MKKRMVSVLLGLAMAASALTGCGNGKENGGPQENSKSGETSQETGQEGQSEEGVPEDGAAQGKNPQGADGEIPVDYFAGTELEIAIRQFYLDQEGNYDEKPIVKRAEEATGIHINWIVVEDAVAGERVDTMLASNNQPDAYMGLLDSNIISKEKDMFYDMSELLPVWAPNVYDDYVNGGQNILDMITMSDGSIRALVGNEGSSYPTDAQAMWYINQKWLNQLEMEIPTTADELYEVLCAFRDNDMNGNGDATDEIPLAFSDNDWCAAFMNYANAFGIAGHNSSTSHHYKMLKDGVVQGTMQTEEYRAFLGYFHKLAAEGLVDVEGFSQTTEQYWAKLAEDRAGIFLEWDTSPAGTPGDYVAMVPFKGMDGVEPVKSGTKDYFYGGIGAVVPTTECGNVEALLHWWNYISSTRENKCMARFGGEGIGFHYEADGTLQSGNDPKTAEEDVDYTQLQYNQALANVAAPYITPEDTEALSGWQMDDYKATPRGKGSVLVEDMLMTEYIPNKMIAADAVTERTMIETDLFPIIDNFRAKSIMEGVTDESWNAYLADLEAYRYYEWIDWWQDYLDGKF